MSDNIITPPPDVERIEEMSNHGGMTDINTKLRSDWVLLGIAYKRHAKGKDEYQDEVFYIVGKLRGTPPAVFAP